MIVYGLTGFAGAGKSTVAEQLVNEFGFTKVSFAGPLKKMLRTLNPILSVTDNDGGHEYGLTRAGDIFKLGWTEHEVKHDPEMGPEYRRLLQVLATDCIRAVDEGFWVRAAMAQLTEFDGRYVFDDVRFPNEGEAVQWHTRMHQGGLLLNVVRPDHDGGAGNHASEQWAGNLSEDFKIENTGDLEALRVQVRNLMYHLL